MTSTPQLEESTVTEENSITTTTASQQEEIITTEENITTNIDTTTTESTNFSTTSANEDSCTSSPCQNQGTCTANSDSYSCSCQSGYTGTNCESRTGRLRLYIRYGRGLPDEDPWPAGDSDPYVRVVAYDSNSNSRSREIRYIDKDESPSWYQWLDFGRNTWTRFEVRVYDDDWNPDDALSNWVSYYLNSHTTMNNVIMYCYSGYIVFDYEFQP